MSNDSPAKQEFNTIRNIMNNTLNESVGEANIRHVINQIQTNSKLLNEDRSGLAKLYGAIMKAGEEAIATQYTPDAPTREEMRRSMQESYHDRLMARINEELSVELRAYNPTRRAQRKGRLYKKQLATRPEMSWSGDSATVEDLPGSQTPHGSGVDPETFVKHQVIKLMTQAQEQGVKMTHGQAHKMAVDALKKHMGQ